MSRKKATLQDRAIAILDYFCVICLVFIMILVLAAVFFRFTKLYSMGWMEEILYLSFMWMVFVKTAILFLKHEHLKVEVADLLLSKRVKAKVIQELIINIFTMACLIIFLWGTVKLCSSSIRVSPMLGLSMKYWYASVCFSFSLMLIFTIFHIIQSIKKLFSSPPVENPLSDLKTTSS